MINIIDRLKSSLIYAGFDNHSVRVISDKKISLPNSMSINLVNGVNYCTFLLLDGGSPEKSLLFESNGSSKSIIDVGEHIYDAVKNNGLSSCFLKEFSSYVKRQLRFLVDGECFQNGEDSFKLNLFFGEDQHSNYITIIESRGINYVKLRIIKKKRKRIGERLVYDGIIKEETFYFLKDEGYGAASVILYNYIIDNFYGN